ncbi:MAG: WD40/YVTN/BNR-like repeat-containing protein [Candidatus Aminicenantales bacterium]
MSPSFKTTFRAILLGLLTVAAAGPFSAQTPTDPEGNLIRHLTWRNIGPANMVGRISDFEALDNDFTQVLVASASGGVFKSVNAGTTWEPIFDRYGSASIGDVAFFQKDPNIIWVGTGEECSRNSVAWGDGVYKSTDGGKTFARMGLETTQSIGKVMTHPTDPNVVYVAASGHTWGTAGERGLFKTTDGGTTWTKLAGGLPDDGKTGAIDLVMDPSDPETLYVGFWQRLRRPWRFDSGGPNGGIFKTIDGGKTWTKLMKGLPAGDTGRIGLAISRSKPKVLMAYVEHGFQPKATITEGGKPKENPDYKDMTKLGTGIYRSEDGGESWIFVNRMNNRPFYYSHIYINPLEDMWVYSLATSMSFSTDGGRTWKEMEGLHPDFHTMWLDPTNKNRMYVGQDGGASLSHDNGKTWIFFDNLSCAQFYAVCADMRDPYFVYGGLQDNGTWGGPSMSREGQILTDFWYNVGGGDGFHTQIDPTDWRTLYGESQGGSISRTNVETREMKTIRPTQATIVNFKDYFPAAPAPPPELKPGELPPGAGEDPIAAWRKMEAQVRGPFRYNWSSPIVLSPHNPRTIYLGGNQLFKSTDRGDKWMIISPDLSANNPEKNKPTGGLTDDTTGAETHGTIITISESPLRPGLLWVGTDDGNVQVSRDGGAAWTNVRSNIPGLPEEIWCSRVEASRFDEGTAYVAFDGHRSDDFRVYVFKTADYGKTWTPISKGIPDGQPVYVIREDLKVKNLLFLGTEFGVFLSRDGGQNWTSFSRNLPTVAVHDLYIHPRDNDLIAATHGRGLWIMDDISALRQAIEKVVAQDLVLLEPGRPGTKWLTIDRGGYGRGNLYFKGENPRAGTLIHFYCKVPPKKPGTLEISDIAGRQKTTFLLDRIEPGLNRLAWDFAFDPAPAMVQSIGSNLKTQLEAAAGRTEATPEQKTAIAAALKELEAAGGNYRRIQEIRRKAMDLIGRQMFGRFFGGPGGRGLEADAGTYVVKLTVDDKTLTGTVAVRLDPLLAE